MEYLTYFGQRRHLLQENNSHTIKSQPAFLKVSMFSLFAHDYRKLKLPSFRSLFISMLQTIRIVV